MTCGRTDCGLSPNDKFCMTCGKAAAAVAAEAGADTTAPLHVTPIQAPLVDAPPATANGDAPRPVTADLSDFATGATEQNAVYIGNRLLFRDRVEEMDPIRNTKVLKELIVQMLLFIIAPLMLTFALGVVSAICWVINQVADNALTNAISGLATALAALSFLAALVCCVVVWFRKVPIGNSEWIMFLDDNGVAAPLVFAYITNAFRRRQTPADSVRIKRVPLPGRGQRDMLEVRYGVFTGYVTAYQFGSDLHIGWIYFWHLSIVRYVLLALSNLFNALRGRQTEMHVLARYEPAKTMREALHAAAREGVDVAGAAVHGQLNVTLPSDVPVDTVAAMPSSTQGLFAS